MIFFKSLFSFYKRSLQSAVLFLLWITGSFFYACNDNSSNRNVSQKRSYAGQISILNASSIDGAAVKMQTYLRRNGFDVLYSDSYSGKSDFAETVLAVHESDWEGAKPLQNILKTKNVLYVKDDSAYVSATVYLGKDFKNIIEQDFP